MNEDDRDAIVGYLEDLSLYDPNENLPAGVQGSNLRRLAAKCFCIYVKSFFAEFDAHQFKDEVVKPAVSYMEDFAKNLTGHLKFALPAPEAHAETQIQRLQY